MHRVCTDPKIAAMEDSRLRRLWGRDFRVVASGLDEADVGLFVEELMSRYQASLEKSSHIEPLHELARKTVAEAERFASEIRERGEKDAQHRAAEIISEAEHSGHEVIQRAFRAANAIEEESRAKVRERVADLEATFSTMQKWAVDEFQALQELDERMRVFLSAYESFLRLLERGIEREEPPAPDNQNGRASLDRVEPSEPGAGVE